MSEEPLSQKTIKTKLEELFKAVQSGTELPAGLHLL